MISLTPEGIAEHQNFKMDDWIRKYNTELYFLKEAVLTGSYQGSFDIDVDEFREWVSTTPSAFNILDENDVALYPPCLNTVKEFYLTHRDIDFTGTILLTGDNTDLRHQNNANYGVTRFEAIVGKRFLKILLKHLNMDIYDFIDVYGECLLNDPDCLDTLLVELLDTGVITGEKRGYKVEAEL